MSSSFRLKGTSREIYFQMVAKVSPTQTEESEVGEETAGTEKMLAAGCTVSGSFVLSCRILDFGMAV